MFEIKARGKTAEILIYEDIGDSLFGGVSAKTFADELKSVGSVELINLRLNSPGGSVFDGVSIYNTLVRNKARVEVDIDGLAASIASIVAMAGDEVRIAENAFMMIHDPWIMTMGTANDLRDMADTMDKVRQTLVETYVNRSSADAEQVSQMMADETWMTAAEALDAGLVDKVTGEQKMAASIDKRILAKFSKTPAELLSIAEEPAERPRVESLQEKMARMNVGLKKRNL